MDDLSQPDPAHSKVSRTPSWVRVQGLLLVILVLVILGMSTGLIDLGMFGFQHGPTSSGSHQVAHG